jgi:hypothetical protein
LLIAQLPRLLGRELDVGHRRPQDSSPHVAAGGTALLVFAAAIALLKHQLGFDSNRLAVSSLAVMTGIMLGRTVQHLAKCSSVKATSAAMAAVSVVFVLPLFSLDGWILAACTCLLLAGAVNSGAISLPIRRLRFKWGHSASVTAYLCSTLLGSGIAAPDARGAAAMAVSRLDVSALRAHETHGLSIHQKLP